VIEQHPTTDMIKGKQVINFWGSKPMSPHEVTPKPRWERSDLDHAKLNIDESIVKGDGTTLAGTILRGHDGAVIFVVTHVIFNCFDPLKAEMAAMDEGPISFVVDYGIRYKWCNPRR
jgi:hypothetical protein